MTSVIESVRIVDGTGAPPIPDGRVVIDGTRIVASGRKDMVPLPAGAEMIDGTGQTVLPGLIDVHVHDPSDANMARYVRCGVTSIRFAGGEQRMHLGLRDRIERGETVGPRVFSCGHMLDGTPHSWPGTYAVDSPAEARRVVRRAVLEEKVDAFIATHRVDRATLAAIVEAAHEHGVPVTGQIWHASARDAARVGMDGLENTSRIPEHPAFDDARLFGRMSVSGRIATLAHLWANAEDARLEEIAGLLADRRVALAPELVSFEGWAGMGKEEVQRDPEWPASTDDPGVVGYARHCSYISMEWKPEDFAAQAAAIEKMKAFCRTFVREGGALVAGTDMGFGGILLHREIRHFVDAGLTPLEAIRTATRQAASALARDDLGQISAGRTADLILVAGDPATDIGALRSVQRTIIGGRTAWTPSRQPARA